MYQTKHFIQICSLFSSSKCICTINGDGLTFFNIQTRQDEGVVSFASVISINYQYNNEKEVSLSWHRQSSKDKFKQINWKLFTHNRDAFLTEYYTQYELWQQQQNNEARMSNTYNQAYLLLDNYNLEAKVNMSVTISTIILHLQEIRNQEFINEKFIPVEELPNQQKRIRFMDIGLIIQYQNALEFYYKNSHQKVVILFDQPHLQVEEIQSINQAELLLTNIQKNQSQYLGFSNKIEDKRNDLYQIPQGIIFEQHKPLNLSEENLFQQTREQNWKYKQFKFQQFAWKTIYDKNYLRRVLLVLDETTLMEFDESINDLGAELILLNRFPLKGVKFVIRGNYTNTKTANIQIIFKDFSKVEYIFEPFQRDIFLSSFFHFIDCSRENTNINDSYVNDSFNQIQIFSTFPDLKNFIHGLYEEDSDVDRYLMQLICSSQDERQFYENIRQASINVKLKSFKDSSIAPFLCVVKVAVKLFDQYLKQTDNKEYQKAYRILRVLKNQNSSKIINSLKGLKRKFNEIFNSLIEKQSSNNQSVRDINQSWVNCTFNANPVRRALGSSLACSYYEYNSNEDNQYDIMCDKLKNLADQVIDKMEEQNNLDQEAADLMMLKMEEVLHILSLLIECQIYYQEFIGQGQNSQLYSQLIKQILSVAIEEPNPQLNFCACFFISKLCANTNNYSSDIKSRLLESEENQIFLRILHSLSTAILVHDSDHYNIQEEMQRRQSSVIFTDDQLLYLFSNKYPSSFLREELYTYHIVGLLKILEAFIVNQHGLTRTQLKIICQYLQTPYFIAVVSKLTHYKSVCIQAKIATIFLNLLIHLKTEMFNQKVLSENSKNAPCTALLLFTRNFELIQILTMKSSTLILKNLLLILNDQSSSKIQVELSILLLSQLFYKNPQTSNLIIKTFPPGLFGLKIQDSIDSKKICLKVSEWSQNQWLSFFTRIKEDFNQPNVVWGDCERVLLNEKLQVLDFNFTYSQAAYLSQNQVDFLLSKEGFEENFVENLEKELFQNTWNISQYQIEYSSLKSLLYISPYYLQILLANPDEIKKIGKNCQQFSQNLLFSYLDLKNLKSMNLQIHILQVFAQLYKSYTPYEIEFPVSLIDSLIFQAAKSLVKFLVNYDQKWFNSLKCHIQVLFQLINVYEVFIAGQNKSKEQIRFVWEVYQQHVNQFVENQGMNLISEVLSIQYWLIEEINQEEWIQMIQILIDILREVLLSQPQMDLNHFIHPYPRAKHILLQEDNQVHIEVLLNHLLFEEADQLVQRKILAIIQQQLIDPQSILRIIKIPILMEALISQMKNSSLVETILGIILSIYQVFKKKTTTDVHNKIQNYISTCLFIRKVPYDQEKEIIRVLPFLRILPYQLSRKLILCQDHKQIAQLISESILKIFYNLQDCDTIDLIWNKEVENQMHQSILKDTKDFRIELGEYSTSREFPGLDKYPKYQLKADQIQQFKFISTEIQCGHIYLRLWSEKINKQRKEQLTEIILPHFLGAITELIKYVNILFYDLNICKQFITEGKQIPKLSFSELPIAFQSYYYCIKIYRQFDNELIGQIIKLMHKQFNDQANNMSTNCSIATLTLKFIKISKIDGNSSLELFSSYFFNSQCMSFSRQEIRFLDSAIELITTMVEEKMNISNCGPYLNHALQMFQTFQDLSPLMLENFVEDIPRLLKISQRLAKLFVFLSQNHEYVEYLIQKCVIWRMIYLITLFKQEEDSEVLIPEMKHMIISFVHTLRNILIQQVLNDSRTIDHFKEILGEFLICSDFLNSLIEHMPLQPTLEMTEQDKEDIARFLLRITSNISEEKLSWNEGNRRDLRRVLNQQSFQNEEDWFSVIKRQSLKNELTEVTGESQSNMRFSLPAGLLQKILQFESNSFNDLEQCWGTIYQLTTENNLGVIFEDIKHLNSISKVLQDLEKMINRLSENKNEKYFKLVKVIFDLLNYLSNIDIKMNFSKCPSLIYEILTISRKANKSNIFIANDSLSFIAKWFDLNSFEDCKQLISYGVAGVLLEIMLKQLDHQATLEAFMIFRNLIQTEYNSFKYDEENHSLMRKQDQLETHRLLNLFPDKILELLTSEQDEEVILQNFYKEWRTPDLIWSENMLNQLLIHIIIYTNTIFQHVQNRIPLQYEPIKEYNIIHPLAQSVFVELENSVIVANLILNEFNIQPEWPIGIRLVELLEQIAESITENIKFNQSNPDSRLEQILLTQFTSFMLALEQYFLNQKHPEFQQHIKENNIDTSEIQNELQAQKDRFPDEIVNSINQWNDLLFKDSTQLEIKSVILQILYLLSESETGIVFISQTDFINSLFMFMEKVLIKCYQTIYQNDEVLLMCTILKIMEYPFIRSAIKPFQITNLLDILQKVKDRQQQNDEIVYLLTENVLNYLINDSVKQKEIEDIVKRLDKFDDKEIVLNLIGNQRKMIPSIWRDQFESFGQRLPDVQLFSKQVYLPQILYPVVSTSACELLTNFSSALYDRNQEFIRLYDTYQMEIENYDFSLESIRYLTEYIRENPSKKYEETQFEIAQEEIDKQQQQQQQEENEDEVFS